MGSGTRAKRVQQMTAVMFWNSSKFDRPPSRKEFGIANDDSYPNSSGFDFSQIIIGK